MARYSVCLLVLICALCPERLFASPEAHPPGGRRITAIWANDGGDKVVQSELRATRNADSVFNSVWDGSRIRLFAAQNETVSANLILEAGRWQARHVTVEFSGLIGPGGAQITSRQASGDDDVFDYRGRNIELFKVRYLQIRGLSRIAYGSYDERQVPGGLQRPWAGEGQATGTWFDRPHHDDYYPDIAEPIELHSGFDIQSGTNQSIWIDVYVPQGTPAGLYRGQIEVEEGGSGSVEVPIELQVRGFALPEEPTSKTMLFIGSDLVKRYTGPAELIRNRHFQMAHRHRISLIDKDEEGKGATLVDHPSEPWLGRLSGALFTPEHGYEGPGVGLGNGVYAIGAYGTWGWQSNATEASMRQHADAWENWFSENFPETERFLYLLDESTDYDRMEQWARWIHDDPGAGHNLKSMATIDLPSAQLSVPSLDIAVSLLGLGDPALWQKLADTRLSDPRQGFYLYNGSRPASGSFAIEDDGTALREIPWGQFKKGIQRWFYWESAYYDNYQGGRGQTDVFINAQTFGATPHRDISMGETGWNYMNGDGVLFYPGTDRVFTNHSLRLNGPLASLRLKHWRRGIEDADYLALAMRKDPVRTRQIVDRMVPRVLWECGIEDPADPTWVRADISWPVSPDAWERARAELADIIEGQ